MSRHLHHLQAIVMAAGKSSRFNTNQTKLTHTICGQELIVYVAKLLNRLHIPTTFILGHQKEEIKTVLQREALPFECVEQIEQKGTGHALATSQTQWAADHLLIINADMPLVTEEIIRSLIDKHTQSHAALTFVTAHNIDPSLKGYGRVIRDGSHMVIVEQRDLEAHGIESIDEPATLINAGIYCIEKKCFERYIKHITPSPKTGEYYISAVVELISRHGEHIETVEAPFDTIRDVNTMKELWVAEHIKKSELISSWMEQGVRFTAPQTTHIEHDVVIEAGAIIQAGAVLTQGSHIGANVTIGAYSVITNSIIRKNAQILPHSVITDSIICPEATIGPFAHIRKQSIIGEESVIGNFVEVSDSTIGLQTKAKHLTYLGSAHIGSRVTIGAGTITCNDDGFTTYCSIIHDDVSIGSNNSLIAPVVIGKSAMTGAGSTINVNVPADALGVARTVQENKEQYAPQLREKKQQQAHTRLTGLRSKGLRPKGLRPNGLRPAVLQPEGLKTDDEQRETQKQAVQPNPLNSYHTKSLRARAEWLDNAIAKNKATDTSDDVPAGVALEPPSEQTTEL